MQKSFGEFSEEIKNERGEAEARKGNEAVRI